MPYYSDSVTDKELEQLEKKINKEYAKAHRELKKKADNYFKSFEKKYKVMKDKYDTGVISKSEFETWYKNSVGRGERWEKLRDDMADRLTRTNEIASAYINDKTPTIFSLNLNYENYEIEKGTGVSFSIYDEQTVKRLIKDNPQILPKSSIDIPKDKKWNKEKLNSALTSSILQGKTVNELANDFMSVTNMNRVSAIRNARTSITNAQNGGRLESYKNAEQMGIDLMKEWISTPDGRTRESHQDLDGETIGIHETFSNGCMYPADAGGHPAEVYNCRCTMRCIIKGVNDNRANTERRYRNDDGETYVDKYKTYNEWANKKVSQSSNEMLQIDLLKKYGNLTNLYLNGNEKDMKLWSSLFEMTGKTDKDLLKEMSKSADNWENILNMQTDKTMDKFIEQLLEVATDEELSALRLWSGESYANINRYMRYGTEVDEISKNASKNIKNVLDRITTQEEIIVKRGTGTKSIFKDIQGDWKNNLDLLLGKEFKDKGFVATSPLKTGGFSGIGESQAELFIRVPKGTHGAYIGNQAYNEMEKEFLLQSNYSYRIIKAEYRANPLFPDEKDLKVWCEVVLNE